MDGLKLARNRPTCMSAVIMRVAVVFRSYVIRGLQVLGIHVELK
jgi:hypothetical protein